MRTSGKTHAARSIVAVLGATLVVAGAGLAAARTMSGPPWQQPLLTADCATDGTTVTDATTSSDCTPTTDPADAQQQTQDVQTFFEGFKDDCGTSLLGQADLTDQQTLDAFSSLKDALDSGKTDHGVQSVRVLLANCEAHANEGLRNALYHHGLNWARHYEHELWLEQKFADKWPDGKPGGGHDAESTHGKPDVGAKIHGNPHASDPTWSPGGGNPNAGGNGNGFGHTK